MKTISILKYIFTIVGLGMLIAAYFIFSNTQVFLNDSLKTEGIVVDLVRSRSSDSVTYRPVVEFKTNGGSIIEFMSSSGSNPPSYSMGEMVEVLYRENFPEKAKINSFFSIWGVPTIIGGIGFVFFLVGFSILLIGVFKGKKIEYLKKSGVPIKAKFQNVEVNGSLEVNGKNPYQIYAQWINPATSEMHIFISENIWFDPTVYINTDEVTVLIERDNPKKYYVDISFIPKVAS